MAEIYRDSVDKGVEFGVKGATVLEAWIERRDTVTNTDFDTTGDTTVVRIPYVVTRYDGKFEVAVRYEIEDREYIKRETHEVVTPLFTPEELKEYDPDFNSLTDNAIKNLEVIIRSLFETFTGQKFGLEWDTVTFFGSGSSMVGLPKRAIDVSPYRHSNSLTDSYVWHNITNDGWVLHAMPRNSWLEPFEQGHTVSTAPRFSRNRRYGLQGLWGYHSVPEDIVLAAMMLASDYGCDQNAWRDRWIKSIRTADWRIEFDSRAYTLTGNVKVDQILDRYIRVRMVVL